MYVRFEQAGDREQIREVNLQAFETEAEADLVDALRDTGIAVLAKKGSRRTTDRRRIEGLRTGRIRCRSRAWTPWLLSPLWLCAGGKFWHQIRIRCAGRGLHDTGVTPRRLERHKGNGKIPSGF